jgi:hypothetical protein
MVCEINADIEKPEDWPANKIESQLENISIQMQQFNRNPNYKNKEILISLVSDYDLNQESLLGLVRTTEYEVALINDLFIRALAHQFNSLKAWLYRLVGHKTRIQKVISWFPGEQEDLEIKAFEGLFPQLKLYYRTYQKFTVENNKSYSKQLIEVVEESIRNLQDNYTGNEYRKFVNNITHAYISLLNDISYFRCKKTTRIWAFDRNEIYMLFQLAAKLVTVSGDSPNIRPLKGVLMTSISNYILKSRNDYNENYVCKYISADVAEKSIDNHEIWMAIIEHLNDTREKRVIPELFYENEWIKYSWAHDIDFKSKRTYYVSSFCRSINDSEMSKAYGNCIYGYKNDRMAEVLAPVMYREIGNKRIPAFTQVVTFDVIYDREMAKKEINFLCSIIDCFNMEDIHKKDFLEGILQYWILSVKDPEWEHEQERRYLLFMYDEYEYLEIDRSDSNFLKLKTSLFLHPDFILGNNPVKQHIKMMIDDKRHAVATKAYLYCQNCLNIDFDAIAENKNNGICSICGSKDVLEVYPD